MNIDNINLFSDVKEYFKTLKDAMIEGTIKCKILILEAVLFLLGFYTFAFLLLAEITELLYLQSRTGMLPSTIENLTLAFLFWAGHKYCYNKAKEEL
jgi:hypothetical protein